MSILLLSLFLAPAPFEKPTRQPTFRLHGDTWVVSTRRMKFPVEILADFKPRVKELKLYYSADDGRTWELADTVSPDRKSVTFTAPRDGLYWMRIGVVKKDGSVVPKDLTEGSPDQKIRVRTSR